MEQRIIEKSSKYGYIFYISYNGKKFDCFDENPNKHSVKGEFIRRMKNIGLSWAKGVQQAGRTDAGVSAENNLFYISTNYNGDMENVRTQFNDFGNSIFIKKIYKTLSGLVLPEEIEERTYEYKYKLKKTDLPIEVISEKCKELSGEYDVSAFADKKGEELLEHVRKVNITYDGSKFTITGNSFMPKQIRIMVAYILTGEKKPVPSSPLSLTKIKLTEEMEKKIYRDFSIELEEPDLKINKTEKIDDIIVLYVNEKQKGELIGKNGERIKKLRDKYGKVVVKCL